MNFSISTLIFFLAALPAVAGPYPPEAGSAGSTAIPKDSTLFINWANGHSSYAPGSDVDNLWKTPSKAYGKAEGTAMDIVCLGNGGSITLYFPKPIRNGTGADFAVFENSFSDFFLELAFVEVSSNGVNFFRFPTASLTPSAVGAFGEVYPDEIDGFAGKYKQGFGTPFDLATLPASDLLDKQRIQFVRIVDIIGNGATKDSSNRAIYDPTPTVGSGGFDLDAVGVIHQSEDAIKIVRSGIVPQGFLLAWESNPGTTYKIETSENLKIWTTLETLTGATGTITERTLSRSGSTTRFWRIARP